MTKNIKIKEGHKESYSQKQLDRHKMEFSSKNIITTPIVLNSNMELVKGYAVYLVARELKVEEVYYLDENRESKEDKLIRKARENGWTIKECWNDTIKIIENPYDGVYYIHKEDLSDRVTNIELRHQNYTRRGTGDHLQKMCKPMESNGKYYDAVDHLIMIVKNHRTRGKRIGKFKKIKNN